MTVRHAVETRSAVLLVVLSRQPRWLVALVVAALLAGVLVLPAVPGAACLAVLLGLVAWLSYLSWPGLDSPARALRVLAWAALLAGGVAALR